MSRLDSPSAARSATRRSLGVSPSPGAAAGARPPREPQLVPRLPRDGCRADAIREPRRPRAAHGARRPACRRAGSPRRGARARGRARRARRRRRAGRPPRAAASTDSSPRASSAPAGLRGPDRVGRAVAARERELVVDELACLRVAPEPARHEPRLRAPGDHGRVGHEVGASSAPARGEERVERVPRGAPRARRRAQPPWCRQASKTRPGAARSSVFASTAAAFADPGRSRAARTTRQWLAACRYACCPPRHASTAVRASSTASPTGPVLNEAARARDLRCHGEP